MICGELPGDPPLLPAVEDDPRPTVATKKTSSVTMRTTAFWLLSVVMCGVLSTRDLALRAASDIRLPLAVSTEH